MVFSSIVFLYYFLPSVLLLYFIAPRALKNTVLLLSSLIFYGWGEPKHLIVMVLSIASGWFLSLFIERFRNTAWSKFFLVLSIITSLLPLLFFKYGIFALENFAAITGLSLPVLSVTLPVGISFYTFQILSYAVDVYRGDTHAQRSIIKLGTYIALFPQLVAGPIVRYTDIEEQLTSRHTSFEDMAIGLRRFALGLAKKILIANRLGELVSYLQGSGTPSVSGYWTYTITFTLQIYFDFSAYSDMAIGMGRFFGFTFSENFNYPLISRSISEFWRRWHISLGSWFRDYIYIPLGGNRVSGLRWLRNIVVVWLLTGLWHGAAWNFVLWGAYFIVFLLVEKLWISGFLEKHRVLSHVYTLFFVIISMLIFNASGMGEIRRSLAAMFFLERLPLVSSEFLYYLKSYLPTLLVAIVGATPLAKQLVTKFYTSAQTKTVAAILEPIFLVLCILVATAYMVDGSFNPFLYFRF